MNKDLLIVIHTHNISIREYPSIVAFNIQYMQHHFSSVVGSLVEPNFLCSSCTWIKIVQLWWSRCFLEISDLPYEFKCLLVQVYQQYSHVLAKKANTEYDSFVNIRMHMISHALFYLVETDKTFLVFYSRNNESHKKFPVMVLSECDSLFRFIFLSYIYIYIYAGFCTPYHFTLETGNYKTLLRRK
jgi:hypothetical protein